VGQLTATVRLSQTHGGPAAYSDWVLLDPGAASVTWHFDNQTLDAGTNGAILSRAYYNSTPTLVGATLFSGADIAFDAINAPYDWVYSTSGVPSGSYVIAFMASNTPGNTNSVDLTLFDDLAYCAYGTRVKSQFSGLVQLDAPTLLALLAMSADGFGWPLLAYAAGRMVDIATICATAKPSPVYFTAAEIDRFVGSNATPPDAALLAKHADWLKWTLWSYFCECVPGSPTPHSPPVIVLPRPPGTAPGPTTAFTCDNTDLCTQFKTLQLAIAAVLQRVDRIEGMTTLIQRQGVPFGYITGATYAGLYGQGEYAVSDLIGLAVNFTTIPSSYIAHPGDPLTYHQIGKISVGTAEGWERSWMPTHDPYIILPISGAITKFGYTFPPGIVAAITELVREP
jgi:hypothetical protein